MKKFILATLLATFAGLVHAQIPNAGFENWETLLGTTTKTPSGFISSNYAVYDGGQASVFQIAGVSGKGASLVTQMMIDPDTEDTTYEGGFLMSGELDIWNGSLNEKFPVSGKPLFLKGHYHYLPSGDDEFAIALVLYKDGIMVGTADLSGTAATNGYQAFSVAVDYTQNVTPDSASLTVISSVDATQAGTILNVDEFSLDYGTPNAVETVQSTALTAYPNPANAQVNIVLPEWIKTGTFVLVNAQGQVVKTGNLYQGTYTMTLETADLPEGVYFVEINDGQNAARSKISITH
ncbi:MAG TPA: hypothetical protein DIW47_12085 [Bacteroidetes bacterium]|nr:hypothetical protein [Bacteroidota bacterium]